MYTYDKVKNYSLVTEEFLSLLISEIKIYFKDILL